MKYLPYISNLSASKEFGLPHYHENCDSNVKAYSLDAYNDARGSIWTHFEENESINSTFKLNITKFNSNRYGSVRGLHGDSYTTKTISVVFGAVIAYSFNPKTSIWGWYYLDSSNHNTIVIPVGYGNGFVSLVEGTVYCYTLRSTSSKYVDADEQFTIKFSETNIKLPDLGAPLIFSDRDL